MNTELLDKTERWLAGPLQDAFSMLADGLLLCTLCGGTVAHGVRHGHVEWHRIVAGINGKESE